MIGGISPLLVQAQSQKAGGMDVTGKSKSEKNSFAELMPDRKVDPQGSAPEIRSPQKPILTGQQQKALPPENGVKVKGSGGPREKAILKFMDSFESEFGIPPQRMVEAMADIPPSLQDKTPLDTATKVIGDLPLSDKEKDKALDMYVGFLMQLQNMDKRPQAALPAAEIGASSSLLAMQAPIGAKTELAEMSGSAAQFAAKGQAVQKYKDMYGSENFKAAMKPEGFSAQSLGSGTDISSEMATPIGMASAGALEKSAAADLNGLSANNALGEAAVDGSASDTGAEAVDPKAAKALALLQRNAAEGQKITPNQVMQALRGTKLSPEMQEKVAQILTQNQESTSAMSDRQLPPELMGGMSAMAQQKLGEEQQQNSGFFQQQGQQGFQDPQDSFTKSATSPKDFFLKDVKKADFKEKLSQSMLGSEAAPLGMTKSVEHGIKFQDLVSTAPAVTVPDDGAPPMHQLMNQAQVLLRQGGGEMKVQLNPEGLGIVDLKVALVDGKLNVHMAAEEKETKKIIESGLSELKSSLNTQHLAVDNIHIDVVHHTGTENRSQSSLQDQGQNQDGNKQFWQQFQENFGNRSRRDEWLDWANNPNASTSSKRYNPWGTVDTVNKVADAAAPRTMNSQRLNMVA